MTMAEFITKAQREAEEAIRQQKERQAKEESERRRLQSEQKKIRDIEEMQTIAAVHDLAISGILQELAEAEGYKGYEIRRDTKAEFSTWEIVYKHTGQDKTIREAAGANVLIRKFEDNLRVDHNGPNLKILKEKIRQATGRRLDGDPYPGERLSSIDPWARPKSMDGRADQ